MGCASVKELPPHIKEVPWNKNVAIIDMTYKELGQFLVKNGYVLENSNSEFGQLTTSYFDPKYSNYQQTVRIEGTEIDGQMHVKMKYTTEKVGEGYGCKCAQIDEFFKAPFYELLWIFDGKVVGYDFTGERPVMKVNLF
tara:strand:+ start:13029 stop:13445 length:417 start_codon:yes stop_codon:yes gene_type:complete